MSDCHGALSMISHGEGEGLPAQKNRDEDQREREDLEKIAGCADRKEAVKGWGGRCNSSVPTDRAAGAGW